MGTKVFDFSSETVASELSEVVEINAGFNINGTIHENVPTYDDALNALTYINFNSLNPANKIIIPDFFLPTYEFNLSVGCTMLDLSNTTTNERHIGFHLLTDSNADTPNFYQIAYLNGAWKLWDHIGKQFNEITTELYDVNSPVLLQYNVEYEMSCSYIGGVIEIFVNGLSQCKWKPVSNIIFMPTIMYYDLYLRVSSLQIGGYSIGEPIAYLAVEVINQMWANKETRLQANPIQEQIQTIHLDLGSSLVGKSGNYSSLLDRNGEKRKAGYYQSTVTVSDIPKPNTRVLCFTNDGQLLDETYSNESGVYRFDHLLMDDKYLFVAQYNNGNPKVAPDYLAAAADWQTPTAYGSD